MSKKYFNYAHKLIRLWCVCLFYAMGFRYERFDLTSKKIEKDRQYIFIANHTSIIDIMLTYVLLPNHHLCYVGKKELVKIPIFGAIYKRICVMVDRNSPRSRADVYRRCAEKMQEGNSIVIYPEGGVPDDTSVLLDDFKDGAFTLATKHHFPIAVFTFVGLKEMFPFDHSKGHPGKVKVYFNDIIEPDSSLQEMKQKAYNEIKSVLVQQNTQK